MQGIILAAGIGRRLLPYTKNTPKCLIKINGKRILDHQIGLFKACGLKDIIVICGFKAEKIRQHLKENADIRLIYNPYYSQTNSVVSLWLAIDFLKDGLLIMNSDIITEKKLLNKVIGLKAEAAVLVDRRMQGYRVKVNKGNISHMSMEIPQESAFGTYAGVTKISDKYLGIFKNKLERWVGTGRINDWYEDAVMGMVRSGVKVKPVLTDDYLWCEIDTPEELRQAKTLLKRERCTQ